MLQHVQKLVLLPSFTVSILRYKGYLITSVSLDRSHQVDNEDVNGDSGAKE